MGLLDLLKQRDINVWLEEFKETKNAVLLDVRTIEEVREERIPGSINIPLDEINSVANKIPDKSTPLFVHCFSGARSGRAVDSLKKMGYTNATNIGGISSYKGEVERG
ncbi:MAG: rhodanese-like domain-containing protein [Eubacteriales bacterium]|nr:rhodanese-like domain-containing protein [Eubacteriales bacterium]